MRIHPSPSSKQTVGCSKRHLISSFAGHSTLPTETGFKYSYLAIRNNQFRKDKNTNESQTRTYILFISRIHWIRITTQNVLFANAYKYRLNRCDIANGTNLLTAFIIYRKGCRNVLMILSQGNRTLSRICCANTTLAKVKEILKRRYLTTRHSAPHYTTNVGTFICCCCLTICRPFYEDRTLFSVNVCTSIIRLCWTSRLFLVQFNADIKGKYFAGPLLCICMYILEYNKKKYTATLRARMTEGEYVCVWLAALVQSQ